MLTDRHDWVSDSPYLHAFDGLDKVHCQMEEQALGKAMEEVGYRVIAVKSHDLPNGKELLRMDFVITPLGKSLQAQH